MNGKRLPQTTLDSQTTLDKKGQEVESLPCALVDYLGELLAEALLQDLAEESQLINR